MAKARIKIPEPLRSQILIANQHACSICGGSGVQIHHINGDPSNNNPQNLAVLCLRHHDEATSVTGLSAKLSSSQIYDYKVKWEKSCHQRVVLAARGRTAFFMVDYKNADRIRQVYDQLTESECQQAYRILGEQFQVEEHIRRKQGFDISLEPNTSWNEHTERMLSWVQAATSHPAPFHKAQGHPRDSLLPTGPIWQYPEVAYYDLSCQIMIRAILSIRQSYDLDELLKLENPMAANLNGSIVTFKASLKGRVEPPTKWETAPTCHTLLTRESNEAIWRAMLRIKTHYVYSDTAAEALSKGLSNGVLILRNIISSRRRNGKSVVRFEAIPLIVGSGVLNLG